LRVVIARANKMVDLSKLCLGGWGVLALTIPIDAHGPSFNLILGPCLSL